MQGAHVYKQSRERSMTISPSVVCGLMLAALLGAVAPVIVGGGGGRLLLLLAAAWLGFALGEAIGGIMRINALSVGPLNTLAAVLGALVAILAAAILSGRERHDPAG